MNGIIATAHRLQQARYTERIAEHGLLAALAPYTAVQPRRIPAQRIAPGPERNEA